MDSPAHQDQSHETHILTYHCTHCTHLLLATTHTLTTLPTRRPPALDRAIILPMPSSRANDSDEEDSEPEDSNISESRVQRKAARMDGAGYSVLLSTTVDRKPVVIRREDGFEKRVLLRCGRCRVAVGYKIDEGNFKGGEGKEGRMVYLLRGGLVCTEDMVEGRKGEEVDAEGRWS